MEYSHFHLNMKLNSLQDAGARHPKHPGGAQAWSRSVRIIRPSNPEQGVMSGQPADLQPDQQVHVRIPKPSKHFLT
jgi:hypothetical protein